MLITRQIHAPDPPRTLDLRDLLRGHQWVHIDHRGERYTLRMTRRGRLILTK